MKMQNSAVFAELKQSNSQILQHLYSQLNPRPQEHPAF
jgi:hypothetical protein